MQLQFQEIKDILASCQDQLNSLSINTPKTTLTAEEKEKYFEIDLVVRSNRVNGDKIRFAKNKVLIPKDIFAYIVPPPKVENYENESAENMLLFLNQRISSVLEQVFISQMTKEQLIPLYKGYKLKTQSIRNIHPINKEKLFDFLRTLDPEYKMWKNFSMYSNRSLTFYIHKYFDGGKQSNRYHENESDGILYQLSQCTNIECDSKFKIILG